MTSQQSITLDFTMKLSRKNFPPFLTHRSCSQKSCMGNAIDFENFQTLHVDESCSCSFEHVASGEVARVIRQGSFPLIEIKSSSSRSGGLELHIRSWKRSSRYTSISHVWSHGLGNQSSNSLPTCELRKFLKEVQGTRDSQVETQLIWMDTRC